MKHQLAIIGLCMISYAAIAPSCSEEAGGFGSGEGRIMPTVDIDTETIESEPTLPNSRAVVETVTKDDLSLRIAKSDGSYQNTWEKLTDYDANQTFAVGAYTVEAFYGDPSEEGYELPAFSGSCDITVADGRTTQVALTATPANAMFSIDYSEAFVNYMQAYSAEYITASNTIAVPADETRPVFVAPGNVSINIAATTPTGKSANFRVATVAAEAGYNYCVHVDVNGGEAGDATLVVTFDENLATETVEIDLSDELLSSPAPTATAVGFDPATAIEMVAGFGSDAKPTMNLIAMAGLKSVALHTVSASLITQGWPADVELLDNADANVVALGLNAIGLWRQPDKMAVLDFTAVLNHITANADNPTSTFTVTVTDKLNRVSEPLTLTVTAEAPNLALNKLDNFVPGENLRVSLEFNGTADVIRNNVEFTYLHSVSGMSRKLNVVAVEAASRAMNSYIVTLATPDLDEPLQITATIAGVSSRCTVDFANFAVAAADVDVYATHAFVTVAGTDGNTPDLSAIKFLAQAQGEDTYKEFTASNEGSYFNLTGLAPATTYRLKAQIGADVCRPITITTEAATQLPNSDMETWEIVAGGSKYWWKSYLGSANSTPWGSMNLITTSAGGSSTSMFNHNGCAYVARSGTDRIEDKHSGEYAAVVKTIGWGYSDANGRMNAKNITIGSLHLGSTPSSDTDAISYGMPFSSRPSALKFWYKYEPRNSADYGYVEIWIKDADGNVIFSKTENISAQASYIDHKIDLSYAKGGAKAASICVIFRSSNNPDCQTISEANLTKPSFGNLSDGKYEGSLFYIDDIELIY